MAAELTLEVVIKLIDQLSEPAARVKKELRGVASVLKRIEKLKPGPVFGQAAKGLDAYADQAERSERATRKFNKSLQGTARAGRQAKQQIGGLQKIELGKALLSGAQGLDQLTRKLDAFFDKPIRDAREFGKGMGQVASVVDTSKISLDKVKQSAFALSEEFGIDSTDQVKAFYQAFSTGATDAAEASKRVEAANILAAAGGADLGKTLKLTTTIMDSFGIAAEESGRVADVVFGAVKQGDTTVDQLATKFGKVTSIAATFGLTFEETANLVAAGTRVLPTTAQAVDGLRAAIKNIAKPSVAARAELEKLFGREKMQQFVEDTSGAIKSFGGFGGTLKAIAEASKNPETTFKKLFGSIQGASFATAIANNDFKLLNETMAANADVTGFAAKAFEDMKKADPGFKLRQQEAAIKKVAIEFGTKLIPALEKFNAIIIPIIETIGDWIGENEDLAATIAKLFIGIKLMNLVLGPMLTGFGTGIRLVQSFSGSMDLAGKSTGSTGSKLGMATTKASKLTKGLGAIGVAAGAWTIGTMIGKQLTGPLDEANRKLRGTLSKLKEIKQLDDIQQLKELETEFLKVEGRLLKEMDSPSFFGTDSIQKNLRTQLATIQTQAEVAAIRLQMSPEEIAAGEATSKAEIKAAREKSTEDLIRRFVEKPGENVDIKVTVEDGRTTAKITRGGKTLDQGQSKIGRT